MSESYLGRGHEDVPGRPFGWAHHAERDEIRARLREKGDYREGYDPRLEFRVSRIQARLRRNRPTYAERQAAWRARQPRSTSASIRFEREELERLVDLFGEANDPVTAKIGAKAAEALRRLDE